MSGVLESITEGLVIKNRKILDPKDWHVFTKRLDDFVREGKARQISPPTGVDDGGYEWYLDVETGDIYCYGSPNPPTLPEWWKFSIQEQEPSTPNNFVQDLSGIPQGSMKLVEAQNLRIILSFMVRDGRVTPINPHSPSLVRGAKETWYRDNRTGGVFRLIEIDSVKVGRWEKVPQEELSGTIQ